MNLVLDTHVLIWALENNPTLSDEARLLITQGSNTVFVSAASIWEISIKKATGRLETPPNLAEEVKIHRFTPLNINFHHAEIVESLPFIHRDPFDRILVAQAMAERLTLITRDKVIPEYNIETVLA